MHPAMEACADELEKIARIITQLKPYQQRVVDRIQQDDQPGLVVAHGLGSGKTLTSIAAQDALGMQSEVIVPSALQANYKKEIKRHVAGKHPKTLVRSMQNMAAKGTSPDSELMIVDEAHRMRDPASQTYKTIRDNTSQKRLLLTGSPFYNHPSDVATLVNVAAGDNVLPIDKKEFESKYITQEKVSPGFMGWMKGIPPGQRPTINLKNRKELRGHLQKWVDYHPSSTDDFPEVERQDVKVEMTPNQLETYDALMGKAPAWVRFKVRNGLPPTKQESKQLNAFLGAARQASNTTAPFITNGTAYDPKIQKAYDELKQNLDANPRAKAVVYSNYLDAGINPYKARLEAGKIPYGEFTGEMSKTKRDELVQKYNEGKIRALLLSSAGGEGLDLKGTRLIQVLEPHWNDEKLHQVEGRGIRYKSHSDLPQEERKVLVQRYLATRPRSGLMEKVHLRKPGFGTDEYLTQLSQDKERLNNQFRELLQRQEK